jgi:hypothetical protein
MKTLGIISFALFCIALVVVVVAAFVAPANPMVYAALAIIGLVIGIIYALAARDVSILLLATIALLAMTAALAPITTLWSGTIVSSIILNFAALMAPVALISAIKALLAIGLEDKIKIK